MRYLPEISSEGVFQLPLSDIYVSSSGSTSGMFGHIRNAFGDASFVSVPYQDVYPPAHTSASQLGGHTFARHATLGESVKRSSPFGSPTSAASTTAGPESVCIDRALPQPLATAPSCTSFSGAAVGLIGGLLAPRSFRESRWDVAVQGLALGAIADGARDLTCLAAPALVGDLATLAVLAVGQNGRLSAMVSQGELSRLAKAAALRGTVAGGVGGILGGRIAFYACKGLGRSGDDWQTRVSQVAGGLVVGMLTRQLTEQVYARYHAPRKQ